jgi:hypothetical protein
MKTAIMILVLMSVLVSGEKFKPVYQYKAVEMKKLQDRAADLGNKKAEALKYIDQIDQELLKMQGAFSVWNSMPDSIIVGQDSVKVKK